MGLYSFAGKASSVLRLSGLMKRDRYRLLPVLGLTFLSCLHELLAINLQFNVQGVFPSSATITFICTLLTLALLVGYGAFLYVPFKHRKLRVLVYLVFPFSILAICTAMIVVHHVSLVWFSLPVLLIIGQLYQVEHKAKWAFAGIAGILLTFGELWMERGTSQWATLMVKDHPLLELSHGTLLSLGFWYLISCIKRYDDVLKDVAKALHDEKNSADRDALTNLYNRRSLKTFLARELARAQRGGHPLSIAMFDIDHFKQINDVYGHQAGDDVLVELSRMMESNLRQSDIMARYGGEEFVLLLPETRCIQGLMLLERLRQLVEKHPFKANGKPLRVTVSFGITQFDASRHDATSVLKEVDKALYEAKDSGRNKVRAYGLGELSQTVAQQRNNHLDASSKVPTPTTMETAPMNASHETNSNKTDANTTQKSGASETQEARPFGTTLQAMPARPKDQTPKNEPRSHVSPSE
jgi:diguanylate cyclase (GGDEF)-like protein